MPFFFIEQKTKPKKLKGLSKDFLRRHSCDICPLNSARMDTPKMEPTGSDRPLVMILGEYPLKQDDQHGEQFTGKLGSSVRRRVPRDIRGRIRWANAVRCHPEDHKSPGVVEQNCCFAKTERDIGETKPKAVFTFGPIPFANLTGRNESVGIWRGRRFPIVVEGHACWVFPLWDPSHINSKMLLHNGKEDETAFIFDLRNAFGSLDNLPPPVVHSVEDATAGIELLYDIREIAEALQFAAKQRTAGVDLETNGLRPYRDGARILTCGISTRDRTFAFPVDHPEHTWNELDRKHLDNLIRIFLNDSKCRKIVHNLPFELEWFGHHYGTKHFYSSPWECSLSQGYVLDARRGGLSLDFLAFQYFGINLKAISNLDRNNLENAPLEEVMRYNAIDARYHRLLYIEQASRIHAQDLEDVYDHQIRRIFALVLAQLHGVPVDQTVVAALRAKYEKESAKAAKALALDGSVKDFEKVKQRAFNPASIPDVNFLLKKVLKIDIDQTGKGVLNELKHPVAKKILAFREAEKVLSTYILPLDSKEENTVVYPDGNIHPIISTASTITWRTASTDPNAQNYPKHDARKEVRSQIKSPFANMRVVSFDYAGIQARNVAMESKDKRLVEVFRTGYNIHADWRDRILKHYPKWIPKDKLKDEVTLAEFRQIAKNKFVFATFFGASSFTTSEGLGIPREVCDDLKTEFFHEFPGIKKWHEGIDRFYYEHGYVTGLSGFRRYAPVSANERINTPIQSDESIIVMDAMNRLSEMEDPRYQAMLMVHDDLTFLWPKNEIEKRAEVVVKTMLSCPFEWANIVPLGVEMLIGEDWINMKRAGEFMNNTWDGTVKCP